MSDTPWKWACLVAMLWACGGCRGLERGTDYGPTTGGIPRDSVLSSFGSGQQ